MLLVLLVDRFVEIPASYHPLSLFRLLANNMAARVNPYRRRNSAHQLLAGTLAALMLILPLCLILYLLLPLAHQPWFFETLVLFGIIRSRELFRAAANIKQNLDKGHKLLAREQLAPLTLRETARLSTLGITKATIEMFSLRIARQYFTLIFWFMCLGAIPALICCLIQQLAWHWNSKLTQFRHFARPVTALSRLISWLPCQLLALNISLLYNTKNNLRQGRQQAKLWAGGSSGRVLSATAWALQRHLGGPAIYQGAKIRRASVGTDTQPHPGDIRDTQRIFQQTTLTWVLVVLMLTLLSLVGSYN